MSEISSLILNTMLYEIKSSNTNRTYSNPESFSKLLQSSIDSSLGSSDSSSYNNSDISSLGMIMTLTGLLNQNKICESNPSINSGLNNSNQNQTVSSSKYISNNTEYTNHNMDKAINLLKQQVGKPYVWGAEGPDSFDCSGLTQYIYKHALGKDIPRVAADQSKFGQPVSKDNLQPGDLLFFDTMHKGKVTHVGMYIGNGEFIHAANSKKGVIKSSLKGHYDKLFVNARRP